MAIPVPPHPPSPSSRSPEAPICPRHSSQPTTWKHKATSLPQCTITATQQKSRTDISCRSVFPRSTNSVKEARMSRCRCWSWSWSWSWNWSWRHPVDPILTYLPTYLPLYSRPWLIIAIETAVNEWLQIPKMMLLYTCRATLPKCRESRGQSTLQWCVLSIERAKFIPSQ